MTRSFHPALRATLLERVDENFDRWLFASIVMHGALFAFVVVSPSLFPPPDNAWGSATASGEGISVNIVSGIPGITLPSPAVVRADAAANESAGFYERQPAPPAAKEEEAEPIPEPKAPVKTTPPPKPSRTPVAPAKAEPAPPLPSNAVPFGEGGRPALSYGQFATGAGAAGIGFGDGAFGDRYGWYVDVITRRISQNWLQSLVDSRIRTAPRVYLNFEILRNGAIENIELQQSSGIPSLDRSAERAIRVSNPLPALPSDYRGSRVKVNFYFEYVR
jgi:protein TonB